MARPGVRIAEHVVGEIHPGQARMLAPLAFAQPKGTAQYELHSRVHATQCQGEIISWALTSSMLSFAGNRGGGCDWMLHLIMPLARTDLDFIFPPLVTTPPTR